MLHVISKFLIIFWVSLNLHAKNCINSEIIEISPSQITMNTKIKTGFIHAAQNGEPSLDLITPLSPKHWRQGTFSEYKRLTNQGIRYEVVLSDFWGYPKYPQGNPFPYAAEQKWAQFVENFSKEHKGKNILIDIWNEPDFNYFWIGTPLQFFKTYNAAFHILRKNFGENILIGGPSLIKFNKEYLLEFVNYCLENKCESNFISWHSFDENFDQTVQNIQWTRENILNNPKFKNLKIKEISINEYGNREEKYSPGRLFTRLMGIVKGGADVALRACWDKDCFNNSLNGFLKEDKKTKRNIWFSYQEIINTIEGEFSLLKKPTGTLILSNSNSEHLNTLISITEKNPLFQKNYLIKIPIPTDKKNPKAVLTRYENEKISINKTPLITKENLFFCENNITENSLLSINLKLL